MFLLNLGLNVSWICSASDQIMFFTRRVHICCTEWCRNLREVNVIVVLQKTEPESSTCALQRGGTR